MLAGAKLIGSDRSFSGIHNLTEVGEDNLVVIYISDSVNIDLRPYQRFQLESDGFSGNCDL